jgi:WD40-like Beta Propeller Repeat
VETRKRGLACRVLAGLGLAVGALLLLVGPAGATLPGANGRLAFDRYVCNSTSTVCNEQILTINPDGTNVAGVSNNLSYADDSPKWTSGGKILFERCCVGGLEQVFRMDGNGANVAQISNGNFNDYSPSSSPTSIGKITFVHANNIWSMNNDGSGRTQLTSDSLNDGSPVWSPSGTRIAYSRYYYNGSYYQTDIVVMNGDGSSPTTLTSFAGCCGSTVDWSPDGATISFIDQGTLETIPAGGGAISLVRDNVSGAGFSPDNTTWTFSSSGEVYTEPIGGSTVTDLASGNNPAWGPFTCSGSACGPGGGGGPPGTLSAQFIVPSVMSTATSPTDPYSLFWTQGSCSAGATYTLQEAVNGGTLGTVFTGTGMSVTVSLLPGNLYTFQVACGGSPSSTTFRLNGFQEGSASYTGTWTSTSFSGAWGGVAKYSTASGASATFTCTCEAFTWVSDEGSTHGSAKVYVDGVLRKTVNTQTSANKNRVVVFKYGWTTDGFHTMKIVNLATAGHPRVNVDGFLTRTSS